MNNPCLLQELSRYAGLSKEDAVKVLMIVAEFAREKAPILSGNINQFIQEVLSKSGQE